MVNVLIVGSNPSNRSQDTSAFHLDTRSRKVLDNWFETISREGLEIKKHFVNVTDKKTSDNRPLTKGEVEESLQTLRQKILEVGADKIVALGKTSSEALTRLEVAHHPMPHPSGLNRQLNDPNFVIQKIRGLEEYLLQPSSEINLKD